MNQPNRSLFESLETRQLLSASIGIQDGTLTVRGTRRSDHIVVSEIPPQGLNPDGLFAKPLFVTVNGRTRMIDAADIVRVRVEAGAGDDHVEMSDDPFRGSSIKQVFIYQTRAATIMGGEGRDTLIGGAGADLISGGAGQDLIGGVVGDDTLDGDGNSDTLGGQAGADVLRGGNGDDRFVVAPDADAFFGGKGIDVIASEPLQYSGSQAEMEGTGAVLDPALPAFTITPKGTLSVFGSRRSDTIRLSSYATYFRLSVNGHVVDNIPAAGIKRIDIEGGNGDDSIVLGAEDGGGFHIPEIKPILLPVVLRGGAGDDTLTGGSGNDLIDGGDGDDVVAGGPGDDVLDGGAGTDTFHNSVGQKVLSNFELEGNAGVQVVLPPPELERPIPVFE